MPKLVGVLETTLYVEDLESSVRFYQNILGFETIESSERLHALDVAGRQVLLLCKKRAAASLAVGAHDGDGRLHLALAIPAGELAAWEAWLKEHSVAIEERQTWGLGGRSLYFRDPDGHLLELATPGVWSIY